MSCVLLIVLVSIYGSKSIIYSRWAYSSCLWVPSIVCADQQIAFTVWMMTCLLGWPGIILLWVCRGDLFMDHGQEYSSDVYVICCYNDLPHICQQVLLKGVLAAWFSRGITNKIPCLPRMVYDGQQHTELGLSSLTFPLPTHKRTLTFPSLNRIIDVQPRVYSKSSEDIVKIDNWLYTNVIIISVMVLFYRLFTYHA